ncbi:hypothetical protein V5O48_017777 [Marasmius crinis-equi]|uniref:F-box domain-containing protein n=1 Tax=Marasmius crinis-equi TaxID=585013 RepID=A0ABR3EN21_9AGAR
MLYRKLHTLTFPTSHLRSTREETPSPPVEISDLPNEALAIIFRFTYDSCEKSSPLRHPLNPRSPPNVFRNVSKLWRGVAESERVLWRRFEVEHTFEGEDELPAWFTEQDNRKMDLVQARKIFKRWMRLAIYVQEEAGGKPDFRNTIDFTLKTSSCGYNTPVENVIIDVLGNRSQHWRHVELFLSLDTLSRLRGIRGRLSNLETLIVHIHAPPLEEGEELEIDLKWPYDLFEFAPRLKTFETGGIWVPEVIWGGLGMHAPWDRIQKVTVREHEDPFLIHAILKATASSVRSIGICPTVAPSDCLSGFRTEPLAMLRLPKVHSLVYHAAPMPKDIGALSYNRWQVLRLLEMPKLSVLRISDGSGNNSCKAALEMAERSQARVKALGLEGPGTGLEWVKDAMQLIDHLNDSLEVLKVGPFRDTDVTLTVVRELTSRMSDSGERFSKLRQVFFSAADVCVNVEESRMTGDQKLLREGMAEWERVARERFPWREVQRPAQVSR